MSKSESQWKWYGVKTLFRISSQSEPQGTDEYYDPDFTLVEERVVLVKARSFDEALRKAENEARRYENDSPHRNPYGQQVLTRYLQAADAYELAEQPGPYVEVFSRTEEVSRRISNEAVVTRLLGKDESRNARARRRNILDIAFSEPAKGVVLEKKEKRYRLRGNKEE
jgi:hypothetical protein